jgi:hypothetical protein
VNPRSWLPVVVAAALVVGVALAHGLRTNRWVPDTALKAAAAALPSKVPMTAGDWKGEDVELPANQVRMADIEGRYVCRTYTHAPTGQQAFLFVACGRPGNVGAHTPELCYQGEGFHLTDPAKAEQPTWAHGSRLWKGVFSRSGQSGDDLEIWWAWSEGLKGWDAPRDARWHYALAEGVLYKMYLQRRVPHSKEPDADAGPESVEALYGAILKSLKE